MADVLAAATVNLRCNRTAFDKTIQQLKGQLPGITKGLSNRLQIAPTVDTRQIRARVAKAVNGMRPVSGPRIVPTVSTQHLRSAFAKAAKRLPSIVGPRIIPTLSAHHLRAELIKAAKRLPIVAGPSVAVTLDTTALRRDLTAVGLQLRRTQLPPLRVVVDSSALQRLPAMVRGIRMPEPSLPTGGFLKHAAAVTAGTAAYHGFAAGIRAAITGSKGLAAAMLQSNAQFQQAQVTIEHFVKSTRKASTFMGQLRDLALDSPLSEMGALDAGKDLLTAGFELKKIPQLVKTLGDASAASADGLAVTLKGLSRVVKQIKDKGKIDRGDAIQFSTAGVNLPKVLSDLGTLESIKERLNDGSLSIDKVLAEMFKGLDRDYGGLMKKQSKTLGGMFDRMAEQGQQALRKIGEPLAAFAEINLGKMLNFGDSDAFAARIDQIRTTLSKTLAELSRLGGNGKVMRSLATWAHTALDSLQAIPTVIRLAADGLTDMQSLSRSLGTEAVFLRITKAVGDAGATFRLMGNDAAASVKMIKTGVILMIAETGERMRQFGHNMAAMPAGILGAMHGVATKIPQIFSIAFNAVTKIGTMAWPAIFNELKAQLELAKDAIDLVFAHMLRGAMRIAPELAKRIALAMSGISMITGSGGAGLAKDLEEGVKERERARKAEAKGKAGESDPRLADVAQVAMQANDQIGALLRDGIADGYRNGAEMFRNAFPLANNEFLDQARKNAAAAAIEAAAGIGKIKPPEIGGSITDAFKGAFGSLKSDFAGLGAAAGDMMAQRFGGVMQMVEGLELPTMEELSEMYDRMNEQETKKSGKFRFHALDSLAKDIQTRLSGPEKPSLETVLLRKQIAAAEKANRHLGSIDKKTGGPMRPTLFQ